MAESDPYFLPEESSNPYAAPEASLRFDQPTLIGQTRLEPFTAGAAFRRAWRIFKQNPILIIGAFWALQGFSVVFQLVSGGINTAVTSQSPGPVVESAVAFALVILGFLIQLWLACGQAIVLVKAAKEEPTSLNELGSGGRYLLSYFWGAILYILIVGVLVFAFVFPLALIAGLTGVNGQNPSAAGLIVVIGGGIIGFVTLIYVSLRIYLYQFLIVDRGFGGFAALAASFEITKGKTWELLGTGFYAAGVALLGLLACGVGIIASLPLATFLLACAYVLVASEAWGTDDAFKKGEPEILL